MIRLERKRRGEKLEWVEIWAEGLELKVLSAEVLDHYATATAEETKQRIEELVAKKKKQGFKVVVQPTRPPEPKPIASSDVELEAAIDLDPDDPAPRLVYGDWLTMQGHPRGELIAVQTTYSQLVTTGTGFHEMYAESHRLLIKHRLALYGETIAALEKSSECTVQWRNGFIDDLKLSLETTDRSIEQCVNIVAEVIRSPAARFLRKLELDWAMKAGELDRITDALTDVVRPSLRSLKIGRKTVGHIDALLRMFPKLEELDTHTEDLRTGTLPLPNLSTLIATSGHQLALLRALVSSDLPRLHRIFISIGSDSPAFEELCSGKVLPRLETLVLFKLPDSTRALDLILEGGLIRRLGSLTFPFEWLDGNAVDRIIRAADAIRNLKKLDLNVRVTDRRLERLSAIGPEIHTRNPRKR